LPKKSALRWPIKSALKLPPFKETNITKLVHLTQEEVFFAKSTFFHAGQREKKSFFNAEITFFHAGITFFHARLLFFTLEAAA
jgi:hypothetical protein